MAIPALDVQAVRDAYTFRSGSVDDALTRAAADVVRLTQAGATAMSDDMDDDGAAYDDSGYPSVMYQNPKAEMVQALGNFAALVGKIPPGHPVLAPAIGALEKFIGGIETPPRGDVIEVRKRAPKD